MYDAAGHVSKITYPSGLVVTYTRDAFGRISGTTAQPSGGSSVTILSNARYKPFGPVRTFAFGNGLTLTETWDDDYHLSGINTSDSAEAIQNLFYSDDPDGNIQTITDNLNGEHSQSLGYDDLNRVDSASGSYGSQTYQQYDGNGNRGTVTIKGVQYIYNISPGSNQIVSIAQTGGTEYFYYLPSGQVYSDQRNPSSDYQFSYDGYGHLASSDLNSTLLATYGYNGFDQRAQKVAATTDDLYDRAGHMIAEMNDATGAPVREYVWMDDTPVAMVDYSSGSAEIYDIHTDHLGRPQKLTDQSANLVWDGVFDPFGVPSGITGSVTMLLGFPGQYWDSETQLAQNWHRDYDPRIGRYVESDPIGLASGSNTYSYVRGNPARYRDPAGYSVCSTTKKCKGYARVLQGNADTLGEPGGWSGSSSGDVDVAADSAAVATNQWGGKGALRPYIGSISGTSNGVPLFSGITDIIGGQSPIAGLSASLALESLNSGDLIIELPSASQDLGVVPIELTIPSGSPCPDGTSQEN